MDIFAPGCALMIYKPHLSQKILAHLASCLGPLGEHLICCRHQPALPLGTRIINICAGCDRRYRELYPGITTVSLWEVLAASPSFPFPDYGGQAMAVLDACPTRDQARVHDAVRALLARMNITVVEPALTRQSGTCCGDSLYGLLPVDQVKDRMKKRAAEMPADDVVVYCVSCVKSIHIGGKKPRYLVDLLLGEPTHPGTFEPAQWHAALDRFIADH